MRAWSEQKPGDMDGRLSTIIKELAEQLPTILAQIEEANRRAEIEKQRWEKMQDEWHRAEIERKHAQALKDSQSELAAMIESWAEAKRIEDFFADLERQAKLQSPEIQAQIASRAKRARELLGAINSLDRFSKWKAPEEY